MQQQRSTRKNSFYPQFLIPFRTLDFNLNEE